MRDKWSVRKTDDLQVVIITQQFAVATKDRPKKRSA